MPIKNIGVLAFASVAVAAGHGHYQHNRLHARGTGSGAAPAIPTGLPACWGTCFQKAGVSSPEALCNDESVTDCIKSTCATEDTAAYEAWLKKQCNSGAPYPSGPNNGTAGPTGTGVFPTGGSSTSVCTETSTLIYQTTTEYSTYLVTHTLSAAGGSGTGSASSDVPVSPVTESAGGPGGYGPGASSGGPGAPSSTPVSPVGGEGEGEECSDVTVTTTERTTVTVTAGEGSAPSSEAPAPSSYAAPSSEAPEAPSSEAAPSSAAPAPSSSAAPTEGSGSGSAPSSYVSEADAAPSSPAAPSSYEAPSSSAAPAPSSGSPASSSSSGGSPHQSSPPTYDSGFRGKRGIAYNDSSMIPAAMANSGKIGWASNWEGVSKGFENSDVTFIPTLHSDDSYWTGMWDDQVQAAIKQGLPYVFGPNEPDVPSQANMLPADCADFWRQWMEPYAKDIGLVAPSVSSTQEPNMGLDWLAQFMGNCSDCTFAAVNQHWYAVDTNDVENFKDTVNGAAKYNKPVFVGEFAAVGSDSDKCEFLDTVMSWMDDEDSVVGYAYFMAYEGLLVNGGSLTSVGKISHPPLLMDMPQSLTHHRPGFLQRRVGSHWHRKRGEWRIFGSHLLVYRIFSLDIVSDPEVFRSDNGDDVTSLLSDYYNLHSCFA